MRCSRSRPENLIQRAIFQHLKARKAPGVFAFHVPNGGKRKSIEAAIMKGLGVTAGVPDVIFFNPIDRDTLRSIVKTQLKMIIERAKAQGLTVKADAKVLDWLAARGEKLDACLVGEPTSTDRLGDEIKIGRRGSVNGLIVVEGKQGHAAYPHLADNPVPKLARIIDRISTTPLDAGTPHFQPSSLQTTIISVPNTATNVIPASARANFNIRYNDLHSRPKIEAWVQDVCNKAAAEVGAKFSLSFSGTGDVFRTEPGPLVDTMARAVREVTGKAAQLTTNGGTSDARFIYKHCPVIELGLRNATAHQVDEHVPVQELRDLTEIYRRFIAGMLPG